MRNGKDNKTLFVLLSCCFGVVAALVHWFVPTRILLGNVAEYILAALAAVLSLAALGLFVLGFVLPQLQQKKGLTGSGVCYMPALCWSVLGLLFGAAATVAKLIRALSYGFVPVQTEGTEFGFSVLTLINVPVLIGFAVLSLHAQKKQRNETKRG